MRKEENGSSMSRGGAASEPLQWWRVLTATLVLSAVACVSLVFIMKSFGAESSLWTLAFGEVSQRQGFIGNYLALMSPAIAMALGLSIATHLTPALWKNVSREPLVEYVPLFRLVAMSSIALAVFASVPTAIAVLVDLEDGGANFVLVILAFTLLWAPAMFVGRYVVWADEEKLVALRDALERNEANGVRCREASLTSTIWSVLVVVIASGGFSAALVLPICNADLPGPAWARVLLLCWLGLIGLMATALGVQARQATLIAGGKKWALLPWLVFGLVLFVFLSLQLGFSSVDGAQPGAWSYVLTLGSALILIFPRASKSTNRSADLAALWAKRALESEKKAIERDIQSLQSAAEARERAELDKLLLTELEIHGSVTARRLVRLIAAHRGDSVVGESRNEHAEKVLRNLETKGLIRSSVCFGVIVWKLS